MELPSYYRMRHTTILKESTLSRPYINLYGSFSTYGSCVRTYLKGIDRLDRGKDLHTIIEWRKSRGTFILSTCCLQCPVYPAPCTATWTCRLGPRVRSTHCLLAAACSPPPGSRRPGMHPPGDRAGCAGDTVVSTHN